MAKKPNTVTTDTSTEEKIKIAARLVFYKKGFAATRTRDIATEAGINLALLNYYFRSKKKLFDIIMLETMQRFVQSIGEAVNNENTSIAVKVERIVENYIDLLSANPDLPIFLLSEMRSNPDALNAKIGLKDMLMKSYLMKQFTTGVQQKKITIPHPLHFMMNLMGMTVFPFIARPMLKSIGNINQKDFDLLMQDRKKLIPKWINAILKAT